MKNMIYISKRGRMIVFDDYTDETNEYNSCWVEMCPHCRKKYRGILGRRVDDGNSPWGVCSVKGCENDAEYYVDFNRNEVEFSE